MIAKKYAALAFAAAALSGCQDAYDCLHEDRAANVYVQADFVRMTLSRLITLNHETKKEVIYREVADRYSSSYMDPAVERMRQQAKAYCASGITP